ncbi:uncharacterized protein BJ212DRAFT_1331222, partial [Suillus subaureus]
MTKTGPAIKPALCDRADRPIHLVCLGLGMLSCNYIYFVLSTISTKWNGKRNRERNFSGTQRQKSFSPKGL